MAASDLPMTMENTSQAGERFPEDISEYLATLNLEFTDLVLPAIVYLSVLMLIGIVGNGLVLYVYTCKTGTSTITRYIQALAVFDLLSCCLAMPGEIADMSQNYTFGRNPLCKAVRTVNLFCTMASGVTLVVVAVDRYKRICSPLNEQITPRGAFIIVIVSSCLCAVLSLPSAAIFGSRTIPTRWNFVNGTDCSISDQFINTKVPLVYNSFQMLLFLVGAVTITVLYFFVGRIIFRQAHLRKVRERRRSSIGVIRPINGEHISPLPVSDPSTHSSHDETSSPETIGVEKNLFLNPNTNKSHDGLKTKSSLPKRLYISNRQNPSSGASSNGSIKISNFNNNSNNNTNSKNKSYNNSKNNSNHFVEIELSSNTTVSPPETPIDQQYFDLKPLIKITTHAQSKQQKNAYKQNQNHKVIAKRNGSPSRLEQLERQQQIDGGSSASQKFPEHESNKNELNLQHASRDDEILSGNLSGCESNENNLEHHIHTSTIQKSKNSNFKQKEAAERMGTVGTDILKESDKTDVSSVERTEVDCKGLDLLKPHPGHHVDGDSGFGDTGSQERLRWSVTVVTSCHSAASAFPDRKQVLFRSNSDVGSRTTAAGSGVGTDVTAASAAARGRNRYQKEASRRTATSDDEGGARKKVLRSRCDSSAGRLRRHSSFKKFRDLKKLSISDPQGTRRTTLMLFLISLIYVLSFLPHLLLMIIKTTHPTSLSGEGGSVEIAHNILLRSYFINSVANPIIYSFCSRDFLTRCMRPR